MPTSTIYQYEPHPRLEERLAEGPTRVKAAAQKVFGAGGVGRFNSKVGLRITIIVGTMWCAYLFAGIALISLPDALKQNSTVIVAWISSNFLQLVLLPIIIVGQNIQARSADDRAKATYEDAVAVLEEAKQIQAHLAAQDAEIEKILGAVGRASPA